MAVADALPHVPRPVVAWGAPIGSPDDSARTQRVLVAGGGRNTAEILRVDCCDASDLGQWTRSGLLSRPLLVIFLVSQNDRVLAFGELMVTM